MGVGLDITVKNSVQQIEVECVLALEAKQQQQHQQHQQTQHQQQQPQQWTRNTLVHSRWNRFKGKTAKAGGVKEKRVQYAAWDDVNVIAHGLLQLGQGLKEHVDKTKAQLRDVSGRLAAVNGTVGELGRRTQRLRAEGEALGALGGGLGERQRRLLNATAELRERADEARLERRAAGERLGRLEEKVDGLLLNGCCCGGVGDGGGGGGEEEARGNTAAAAKNESRVIQSMLEAQNKRIDDLMERIQLQQEKLDKQNTRIRSLQSQIQQTQEVTKSGKADAVIQTFSVEQQDSPVGK
ncbi:hypothetical protein CRUP_007393 [Coryphaenoides rupestris]|nr:hypothetical protein CRUP_007393 [Coryphaenoides rupestris]